MNPKLSIAYNQSVDGLASQHVLSTAIGLYVYLHFYDYSQASFACATPSVFDMSRLYHLNQKQDQNIGPGVSSIFAVYASTMTLAHTVLQSLDRSREQQVWSCPSVFSERTI
jgi:hypothetical protein